MRLCLIWAVNLMLLGICVLAFHPLPCLAAELSEPHGHGLHLRRLMTMIPDISEDSPYEELRTPQFPPILMVDYRAAEEAGNISTPSSWGALKAMSEPDFAAWSSAMSRFRGDPIGFDQLTALALLARSLPELAPELAAESQGLPALLGIDWFDVEHALVLGGDKLSLRRPMRNDEWRPGDLVVLSLDANHNASGPSSRLPEYGLQRSMLYGFEVWSRLQDGERRQQFVIGQDIAGARWIDPFGIANGWATRIAKAQNSILGSPYLGVLELLLASVTGEIRSLADSTDFRVVFDSLNANALKPHLIIQIGFVNRHVTEPERLAILTIGPYSSEKHRQSFVKKILDPGGGWGHLPPYRLIAVADTQTEEEEIAIIALVYDELKDASLAAELVADRIQRFEFVLSRVPWFENRNVNITGQVYNAANEQRAVALIALSHSPQSDDSGATKRGALFQDLFWHISAGAASFLIVN